jgi:PAS domain S-box-containing protein
MARNTHPRAATGTPAHPVPGSALAKSALDGLSANVCVLDENGTIVAVNAAWRQFAVANDGDLTRCAEGRNYFEVSDHCAPGDSEGAAAFASGLRAVLAGIQQQVEVEYPCHSPTVQRWYRARATRINGSGLARVVVAHEDVTAQRTMDRMLRESDIRYRMLLASMDEGVFVAEDYRFVFANAGLADMLGYTLPEFTGLPFDAVIDPAFLPLWTQRFEARIRGDEQEPPRQYELRMHRKGGRETVAVELRARRFEFEGRAAVLGVVRDISERVRSEATLRDLEMQVRDAQKMEAMARFASAVAHDFNNLLTIIRGTAELLAVTGPAAPSFAADLGAVTDAVDRAAALTTPLLTFGRHQHAEVRRLGVVEQVGVAIAQTLPLPGGVELDVQWAAGTVDAEVLGDRTHFTESVQHLLRNAAESRPRSGHVQLACRRELVTEPLPHRFGVIPPGDFVVIEVTDDGAGMTDEVLDRLFEPFFTTKPQGQGPGLGLPVVYGVVRRAGGSVRVQSEPGGGSTIAIYWPCAPREVTAEQTLMTAEGAPPSTAPSAAADTILVVDDEPGVRRAVARILEREGRRVLLAASGAEAMALINSNRARIQALVTDVRMPEMTGPELVDAMVRSGADMPVLFMSGQLDAPLPDQWPSQLPRHFLRKPFTLAEIRAEIAALAPHRPR